MKWPEDFTMVLHFFSFTCLVWLAVVTFLCLLSEKLHMAWWVYSAKSSHTSHCNERLDGNCWRKCAIYCGGNARTLPLVAAVLSCVLEQGLAKAHSFIHCALTDSFIPVDVTWEPAFKGSKPRMMCRKISISKTTELCVVTN